jgi:hypothetical protein
MEKMTETSMQTKMEWRAPELKKIDVEQITAASFTAGADSVSGS